MNREQEALDYHSEIRPGKLEVIASKPCSTQRELSLAYTPGVAAPCRRIQENPEDAYKYTSKGNLVAVVSNGTAVLGLGDIGAVAGKPVMEGKGVLFKRFAGIDVFDLEIDSHDPDEIIRVVKLLEPTFGGINLEDIKAPECFHIEETLKKQMGIPVLHDDQHGTAIISGAALLNALEIAGKKIDEVTVVFNGAGAAGVACAEFYLSLGVRSENLILCDTAGVIFRGREIGMNPYKEKLSTDRNVRSLTEALRGADVFVGLSAANCVSPEMIRSMNDNPIVFAMAVPEPEITYNDAKAARPDVILATGRSDFPNQINNVLCFPFIFRGALDVRATGINEEMKRAAARALASLAREDVPDSVMKAYGVDRLEFGPEYLIPKPFDHRVLIWESAAVAQAAMESGVAQASIDLDEYKDRLERLLGKSREVMRIMINQAKSRPKRVVFPEGQHEKVLRAAQIVVDEGFAQPILLGSEAEIQRSIEEHGFHLDNVTIIDPSTSLRRQEYVEALFELRQRRGLTLADAREALPSPTVFGALMVHLGDADALVAGMGQHYSDTLRPALQIIGKDDSVSRVAGLHLMLVNNKTYFFADTTVNIDPTAGELADIAICSAEMAKHFHIEPRVAMLSFSNFGSVTHPCVDKVRLATEIVKERRPDLMVDGEMQADTAVTPLLIEEVYPFSTLVGGANVLIFPDLQSANAAFKLVQRLGGAEAIGPILMGIRKPVHMLYQGSEVKDIVYMTALAVVDAQQADERPRGRETEISAVVPG